MAIAIISDIHANKEALDAVLDDILYHVPAYNITAVHCLGDVVGYGPDPEYCARQVKRTCTVVLKGNHDEAVCNKNNDMLEQSNHDAAVSMMWTRIKLENSKHPEIVDYLATRPIRNFPQTDDIQQRIALVHGALCTKVLNSDKKYFEDTLPNGPEQTIMDYSCLMYYSTAQLGVQEYVTNIGRSFKSLIGAGRSICFLGHSHCTEAFEMDPSQKTFKIIPVHMNLEKDQEIHPIELTENAASASLEVEPGRLYVVNFGSVGMPRSDDARAAYGIYTGNEIIFRKVPYDFPTTMHKLLTSYRLNQRTAGRLAGKIGR
jgi:predicted phosphodiesterase